MAMSDRLRAMELLCVVCLPSNIMMVFEGHQQFDQRESVVSSCDTQFHSRMVEGFGPYVVRCPAVFSTSTF